MNNFKKFYLVAGCVCLSLTLFSFKSTETTQKSLGDAVVLHQSQNINFGSFNSTAKTGKIAKKVWQYTCQLVFWEALDYVLGERKSNFSDISKEDIDYKLSKL